MATQRQIDANRRNSQKSTGPKTEAGKAASSQNALKHCLHAKDFLLYFEDFDGYDSFRLSLMADFAPKTAEEVIYIDQIAQSYFLSRRAVTCMAQAFDASERKGRPVSETYPIFMRMKNQNDRIVARHFETLLKLKKARELAAEANNPNDLPEIGFVPPIYEPAPPHSRVLPFDPFSPDGAPRELDEI